MNLFICFVRSTNTTEINNTGTGDGESPRRSSFVSAAVGHSMDRGRMMREALQLSSAMETDPIFFFFFCQFIAITLFLEPMTVDAMQTKRR